MKGIKDRLRHKSASADTRNLSIDEEPHSEQRSVHLDHTEPKINNEEMQRIVPDAIDMMWDEHMGDARSNSRDINQTLREINQTIHEIDSADNRVEAYGGINEEAIVALADGSTSNRNDYSGPPITNVYSRPSEARQRFEMNKDEVETNRIFMTSITDDAKEELLAENINGLRDCLLNFNRYIEVVREKLGETVFDASRSGIPTLEVLEWRKSIKEEIRTAETMKSAVEQKLKHLESENQLSSTPRQQTARYIPHNDHTIPAQCDGTSNQPMKSVAE